MASINTVTLLGRLTADVQSQMSKSGTTEYAQFSVACDRQGGKNQEADFIRCSAFGQSAKYLSTYGHKGDYVSVEGSLQTNTRELDGKKISTIAVVANRVSVISTKRDGDQSTRLAEEESTEELDLTTDDMPFQAVFSMTI